MAASDGLSIGCEVFPGSVHEGKSLIPALETMRERERIERAIRVADRGMFGEANLKTMEERDLQYIVGARLKSLPKDLKERILDLDAYSPTGGSEDSRSASSSTRAAASSSAGAGSGPKRMPQSGKFIHRLSCTSRLPNLPIPADIARFPCQHRHRCNPLLYVGGNIKQFSVNVAAIEETVKELLFIP